jgi:methyl-accepting chemotaxis protein
MVNSIKNKVVLLLAASTAALTVVITVLLYQSSVDLGEQVFQSDAIFISGQLADQFAVGMQTRILDDGAELDRILESLKGQQKGAEVRKAIVYDADMNVVKSFNTSPTEARKSPFDSTVVEEDDESLVVLAPLLDLDDNKVGHVEIHFSKERINAFLADNAYEAILVAVIALVVVLILGYALALNITRPVTRLADVAERIAEGDYDVQVDVVGSDEIGALADSIRVMIDNIRFSIHQAEEERSSAEQARVQAVDANKAIEEQSRYLERSVGVMLEKMEAFAQGDLSVRLEAEGSDNITQLFHGFNDTVSRMRGAIVRVTEAVQSTAASSERITSSAEEMAAGAQEQTRHTQEVAESVEHMTEVMSQATGHAEEAAQSAKRAGEAAKEGEQAVEDAVSAMNELAETVNSVSETVFHLGQSGDQIGEIIQVIEEIADQTNLLALNAAIEAARAGEQGRGFAVVADEVRKLAERTTKATKEISSMIKQIQNDTITAVKAIGEGAKKAESGKQLAHKAGASIREIVDTAQAAVDVVTRVAKASQEQTETSERISQSIETISEVSGQFSTGIQEIARSSEDLRRLTEELKKLTGGFEL